MAVQLEERAIRAGPTPDLQLVEQPPAAQGGRRPRRARRIHRFTTDDYERMIETGVLTPNDRVELLDGVIVKMAAMGAPHIFCVNTLKKLLDARGGDTATVFAQGAIRLDNRWEPEPDVMVLQPPDSKYKTARITAADVLLLIEVSDTTLHEDRRVKGPRYARARIPEYWIVNLVSKVVEVYTQPEGGRYTQMREVGAGESLTPVMLPQLTVAIEEFMA